MNTAQAQGYYTEFIESKRQSQVLNWRYVSSDHFDAYFTENMQEAAQLSLESAERQLKELEELIDYRMSGKTQILLYTNAAELQESNLFVTSPGFITGGYAYTLNNQVVVSYNGIKADMDRQIRYGIAELLVSELLYGGSFQEKIQSNTLLYLPEWYYKGLLRYLAEGWNPVLDGQMRDAIVQKSFANFNLLSSDKAILAGHSWWYFIDQNYGRKSIPDLLYLTRLSKGYENALVFVLGARTKTVFNEWISFFDLRYNQDGGSEPFNTAIALPAKWSGKNLLQSKLSPDEKKVALVFEERGKYELALYDIASQSIERIYKSGEKAAVQIREQTAALSWNNNKELYFFYRKAGKAQAVLLNTKGTIIQEQTIDGINGVHWANSHPSENLVVLSAYQNASTDLYLWVPGTSEAQLLFKDNYEDLYPSFTANGDGILFSSDRNNQLPGAPFQSALFDRDSAGLDIYLIPYPYKANKLKRISSSPFIQEIQAQSYGKSFAYLSDNNGLFNTYVSTSAFTYHQSTVILTDSTGQRKDSINLNLPNGVQVDRIPLPDSIQAQGWKVESMNHSYKDVYRHYALSNYARNITNLSIGKSKELSIIRFNSRYYISVLDLSTQLEEDAKYIQVKPTGYRKATGYQAFVSDSSVNAFLIERKNEPKAIDSLTTESKPEQEEGDFYFQTGFPPIAQVVKIRKAHHKPVTYDMRAKPYRVSLQPDYYATQLIDNSIINTYYHPYYEGNTDLSNQFNSFNRITARVELGASDLLNDHSIRLGGRLPVALYGSDFYLDYLNRRHKRDYGFSVYRQSRLAGTSAPLNRLYLQELRLKVIQPFKHNLSLVFAPFYRQDKVITLSTDRINAAAPDNVRNWLGGRLELHWENSRLEGVNKRTGYRAKVYVHAFQNLNNASLSTYAFGTDFRAYFSLPKQIIWANRVSSSHSFGPSSILYSIGGIENWLGPRTPESLGTNADYFYPMQSVVSGLRGFSRNVRNGGNFLLLNSEFRIPIACYFKKTPIKADFLRNLQLIAFYDLGSAWSGLSPFGEQHYNTTIINQGSVRIKRISQNNPFVSGFGAGLRTRIFSYYIRTDLAWGLRNGQLENKGRAQFMAALGFDF
ncbi:MAG: hypothetical protein EP332_02645 [Bacteroidetes bacterium]|nr:MAG: hypothetical protein EP332_02645 [Bacteroidota bacterium]